MEQKKNTVLESLYKSIQTFGNLTAEAENRDKLYRYNDALMRSLCSILEDCECDETVKMQYFTATMEQFSAAMTELFPKLIAGTVHRIPNPNDAVKSTVGKSDPDRYDEIEEVEKFNPYHDSRGRFASANGYASFTTRTKDPSKQHMADAAIAREKERAGSSAGSKPDTKNQKPDEKPDNTKTTDEADGGIKAVGTSSLPPEVLKKCQDVEAKTVTRKTEKMTLVDSDGNIILEKSGGKGSVSFGAKEGFHMNDTTTMTHNHPGEYGGTFSGADVEVFVDYKLKAIRAVGREGTYSLERTSKTNGGDSYDFKQEFKKQSVSVNSKMRTEYDSQRRKVARGETSVDEANKQLSEYRTSLCNDQHNWLVQNASRYGYNYVFTPSEGGVSKMADVVTKAKDEPEETSGDIMLDGEFINGDGWKIRADPDKT